MKRIAFSLVVFVSACASIGAQTPASVTQTDSEGNVTLVSPDDPLEYWRTLQFSAPTLTIPGISGLLGDPDGDSIPNFIEYASGSGPWYREPSLSPQASVQPDGTFTYQFFKAKDAGDVDLVPEFSLDLQHWHPTDEYHWSSQSTDLGTINGIKVVSPLSPLEVTSQFARLEAVRPSLAEIMRVLEQLHATPTQMLGNCLVTSVPPGPLDGGFSTYQRIYPSPSLRMNWYFASEGLFFFVETHRDVVKKFLNLYISHLQPNFTIRDKFLSADMQTVLDMPIADEAADSDDAYAGSFLRLASHFALTYPDDPWFAANVVTLRNIANANIVTQIKPNHVVRVFQGGVSAAGVPYDFGLMMDNALAWAGLDRFVQALIAINDSSVSTFQTARDELRDGIHSVLWDPVHKAWRPNDGVGTEASSALYYPDLNCQYYPQLYGLPHPSGEAETNSRYDSAWQWYETHKPNWWRATAWGHDDVISDLAVAYVANRRGELAKARSYMALAIKNWIPHTSRPDAPFVYAGTIFPEVGFWQALLKNTPPRKLSITPFSLTDQSTATAGASARSNTIVLSGFNGYLTAQIPAGTTLFVNGSARTGTTTAVTAGDALWLQAAAPSNVGTYRIHTLKVGGYSTTWRVTAGAAATAVPDQPAGTVSGYTAVSASVGETGSSQISIPIAAPPGTAGMSPKLAITYSSQGSNSPLGIGFNLSGLSVISRVGKTLTQDGSRGGINLDANDRFALDGQRLIAVSGADGGSGSEYRLELDPGSRIRSYGGTLGNPSYWVVETKAGLTLVLGSAIRGVSSQTGALSPTLSWAVDVIRDTLNNEIIFQYDSAAANHGELLVSRIDYTQNTFVGLSSAQYVWFEYESRPDTNLSSVAGYDVQSLKRLKTVNCFANIGSIDVITRSYALSYQQDALTNESELISVTESGLGGAALPPTQFTWPTSNANEPFFTQSSIADIKSVDNLPGDYIPGDFDRDGKTDVLVWNAIGEPNRFTLFHRTAAGFDKLPTSIVLDHYTRDNLMVPADFDGDGKLDMLLWSEADNHYRIYYSTVSGLDFQSPVGSIIPRGNTDNPIIAGDFNGDGRTDLLVWGLPSYSDGYSLMLAEDTHFEIPPSDAPAAAAFSFLRKWRILIDASWQKQNSLKPPSHTNIPINIGGQNKYILGEFNGDGRADLIVWNSSVSRYDAYLSTGDDFSAPVRTNITTVFSTTGSNITGDFNGDGLTDVMVWDLPTNPGKFTLYRCLGSGVFANPEATSLTGGFDGTTANYQNVIDFNGDGKTDLFTWNAPAMNAHFNITLSTGTGFRSTNVTGNASNSTIILPGDFDGDGKADFLMWDSPANGKFNLWLNQGPKPRLIESVVNGHGAYTKFNYKPLTDPAVHIIGVPGYYPEISIAAPLYVVASMSSTNGTNGNPFTGDDVTTPAENSLFYTYYGAWADAEGRGFQGFSGMLVQDAARGVISTTDYMIDPLLTGRPIHTQQYLATAPAGGSTVLSTSDSTWLIDATTWPNGNKTYFAREDTTTSREYEPNRPAGSQPVKTTTSSGSTYDNYGNLTHSAIDHGDGFTETTNNTYNNIVDADDWLIGRLTASSVTKNATGKPSQTRTSAFSYNSQTGLLISEIIEPNNAALRLSKTYTHDDFGNILTSTFSAAGQPARTTTTTYSDDGRFLLTTTNALGHTESKTYDPLLGNVLSVTGPNGLTSTYEYDFLGRPVRQVRPDGTETRSFYRRVTPANTNAPYRAVHYVVAQSSGSGPQTVWYDLLDREIRTDATAFDGRTSSVWRTFLPNGSLWTQTDPYFPGDPPQHNIFAYDLALRLIQETATGLGRITTTAFDGLTTTVTNPLGQKLITTTNVMGWTVQTKDHENKTTARSYDAYGNLLTVTDSENHVTEIRYDLRGRKTWMSEPNSGLTTFGYNAFGELTTQTDAKNQTVTLTYDRLGRVTLRSEPSGVSTFTFDTASKGIGQLASETGPGFTRSYSYDSLCRPSAVIETHGTSTFVVSRSYDQLGRPDTLTYPTGLAVRQNYNSRGYLASVQNVTDGKVYWQANDVNARGQITNDTLGNGTQTQRYFNVFTGLLEEVIGASGTITTQHEAYVWDSIGNLTRRQDKRISGSLFQEDFTYDTRNRLTRVDTTGATALTIDYDYIGNIVTRSDVGSFTYGEGGVGPHAVTTVTGARAKTCTYDANGNRTHDGGTTLTYSSFNKPISMTKGSDSLQFAYAPDRSLYHQTIAHPNASGTLVTTERDYVSGIYEKEVGTDGTVRHTHYIAGGTGVVAIDIETQTTLGSTHTTRYVHKDHLGSVVAISEADGAVKERLSFDAWGRRRSVTHGMSGWLVVYDEPTSAETHRGFTGHEMLDTMSLVHMNGRVYDPLTGRFLSPDPVVQAPDDLQNLNRYSYVLNNPLSMTDPSGFRWKPWKKIQNIFHTVVKLGVQHIVGNVVGTIAFFASGGNPYAFAAGYGFGSSFAGTLLNGGGIGDALRAGLYGAANGAATFGIGSAFQQCPTLAKYSQFKSIVHGVTQGAFRAAQGGKFAHGFLSGTFASEFSGVADAADSQLGSVWAGRLVAAVVGGTAESIGGGKFANGAVTGMYIRILNDGLHPSKPMGKAANPNQAVMWPDSADSTYRNTDYDIGQPDCVGAEACKIFYEEMGTAFTSAAATLAIAQPELEPLAAVLGGVGKYYDIRASLINPDPAVSGRQLAIDGMTHMLKIDKPVDALKPLLNRLEPVDRH